MIACQCQFNIISILDSCVQFCSCVFRVEKIFSVFHHLSRRRHHMWQGCGISLFTQLCSVSNFSRIMISQVYFLLSLYCVENVIVAGAVNRCDTTRHENRKSSFLLKSAYLTDYKAILICFLCNIIEHVGKHFVT